MPHPLSVRFHQPDIGARLKSEAGLRRMSSSALAEELIEEGLRMRRHPSIVFRDGATGRRAGLVAGPDVWEVVVALVGGDVPPDQREVRAVEVLGLRRDQIDAALDYYASFPNEIDAEIAANQAAAAQGEALWRRRQQLMAG
ncbi:MAG: ribbon-helix-helix protein, CopG family [Chloroflexota bacterium]